MTKKKLVLEVIAETLESINEENEIIQHYSSTIPQIELDLILENIRKLYANYRLLDKYNLEEGDTARQPAVPAAQESTVHEIPDIPEPPDRTEEEPARSQARSGIRSISIGFEIKKETEPEPIVQNVTDEKDESEKVTEPEIREEATEPTEDDHQAGKSVRSGELAFDLFGGQTATIADRYRKEEKTLHEQISRDTSQENLASRIQQTPISELKSAIGLNDKFVFINELFHGNMKAYQETIHTLDQFTTLNDAIHYFTEVSKSFEMNEELESYRKMLGFIQRKFK